MITPTFLPSDLATLTSLVFVAPGVPAKSAEVVADSLVQGNLKGHDSHGIIRIIEYVDWIGKGLINPQAELQVPKDEGAILILDGQSGFD